MRLHYPDEVPCSSGGRTPTTSWADYVLAPDATYENTQGAVWNDFWVSYLFTLYENAIINA
jgi:hypothetical protein